MTTTATDDLHWLAFLYVADELADAERIAFEARLDHDQTAREAVASAVGLVDAVRAVPPIPVRGIPRGSRRWVALGLAASVALAVFLVRPRMTGNETKPITETGLADVALAWSDIHDQRVADPADARLWQSDPVELTSEAGEASASPPSWLVLAAGGEADADPLDLEPEPRRED